MCMEEGSVMENEMGEDLCVCRGGGDEAVPVPESSEGLEPPDAVEGASGLGDKVSSRGCSTLAIRTEVFSLHVEIFLPP